MNELYEELDKLNRVLSDVLNMKTQDAKDIENAMYFLEKQRVEIYDKISGYNEYNFKNCDKNINTIYKEYAVKLLDNILCISIPEKLPTLKNISSYVYKQIVLNVSEVTSKYTGLFCNDFVIIIIKIYDKEKVWDTDNRTIKPIQDGLVNAGVIKDDNFKNSCYMVQGFYSEKPYIDVFVLKAADILRFIDGKLPSKTALEMAKF